MDKNGISIRHALLHELDCHLEMFRDVHIGHVQHIYNLVLELIRVSGLEPGSCLQDVRDAMLFQLI